MYIINKEIIKEILSRETNLPSFDIDLFLKDFPPLDDIFSDVVEQWLKDRTIKEIVIEGLSLKDVMKNRRCHFLAALRDLNVLLDESIPVEKRQKFKETLKRTVHYE